MTASSPGTTPSSAGTSGPAPPRPKFAAAARSALADTRLRRNLRGATAALREREAAAAAEISDWDDLREAGRAIRDRALLDLDVHLEELERAVTEAGGTVHWAADAAEARRIVAACSGRPGRGRSSRRRRRRSGRSAWWRRWPARAPPSARPTSPG